MPDEGVASHDAVNADGHWRVVRGLWIAGAFFLLLAGGAAQLQAARAEPAQGCVLAYLGMLVLGAPCSMAAIVIEQLMRSHGLIGAESPMTLQWAIAWAVLFAAGFVQWFVVAPVLFRAARAWLAALPAHHRGSL